MQCASQAAEAPCAVYAECMVKSSIVRTSDSLASRLKKPFRASIVAATLPAAEACPYCDSSGGYGFLLEPAQAP